VQAGRRDALPDVCTTPNPHPRPWKAGRSSQTVGVVGTLSAGNIRPAGHSRL